MWLSLLFDSFIKTYNIYRFYLQTSRLEYWQVCHCVETIQCYGDSKEGRWNDGFSYITALRVRSVVC